MPTVDAESIVGKVLERFESTMSFELGVDTVHLYFDDDMVVNLTVDEMLVGNNEHYSIKLESPKDKHRKSGGEVINGEVVSAHSLTRMEWFEPVAKLEGIIGNNPRQLDWSTEATAVPQGVDSCEVTYAVEIRLSDSDRTIRIQLDDNYPNLMQVS